MEGNEASFQQQKWKGALVLPPFTKVQKQTRERKWVEGKDKEELQEWGASQPLGHLQSPSDCVKTWLSLSSFMESHALAILTQVFEVFEISLFS